MSFNGVDSAGTAFIRNPQQSRMDRKKRGEGEMMMGVSGGGGSLRKGSGIVDAYKIANFESQISNTEPPFSNIEPGISKETWGRELKGAILRVFAISVGRA